MEDLQNVQIHIPTKFQGAKTRTEDKDRFLAKSKNLDKFGRKRVKIEINQNYGCWRTCRMLKYTFLPNFKELRQELRVKIDFNPKNAKKAD